MSLRRKLSTGAALLAAAATLAGGVGAAPVALAEDGVMPAAGNPTGGVGWAGQGSGGTFDDSIVGWAYEDNNNGGFGPVNVDSFKKALARMGATWSDGGRTQQTTEEAVTNALDDCNARFDKAFPDQRGQAQCRMVGVGVIATPDASHVYAGIGYNQAEQWQNVWNQYVASQKYANNNVAYYTSDKFTDEDETVDALAKRGWTAGGAGSDNVSAVVIALNQYEPTKPVQDYALSVSTNATARTTRAGDTNPIADDVILDNGGSSIVEDVTGTISAHWVGVDGTSRQADKRFTAANNGRTNVQFTYTDLDGGWKAWPAGHIWFDVTIPKQGKMKAAADHMGAADPAENWSPTNVPPVKSLWNAAGQQVAAPDDRIASGSLYTARIEAQSSASGKFWIYDVIDTRGRVDRRRRPRRLRPGPCRGPRRQHRRRRHHRG